MEDWLIKQEELKNAINYNEKSREIKEALKGRDIFLNVSERFGHSENLYKLFWWDISIDSSFLKKEYSDYTDILLMPYRIDGEVLSNIRQVGTTDIIEKNKRIISINKDCWGNKPDIVHIDYNSGNVHPVWDPYEWIKNDGKIRQLILVKNKGNSNLGPRLIYALGNSSIENIDDINCIIYNKADNVRSNSIGRIVVPKDCYYPNIFSDEEIDTNKENYLNEMLDALLKNICK